jgi:hypothetical protein
MSPVRDEPNLFVAVPERRLNVVLTVHSHFVREFVDVAHVNKRLRIQGRSSLLVVIIAVDGAK